MAAAGCELAATISMSPTVSWPRRSDPAGSAQSTPGDAAQAFEHGIGNRDRAAERHARNRARSVGSAAAIAASSCRVHAGDGADQLRREPPRRGPRADVTPERDGASASCSIVTAPDS